MNIKMDFISTIHPNLPKRGVELIDTETNLTASCNKYTDAGSNFREAREKLNKLIKEKGVN